MQRAKLSFLRCSGVARLPLCPPACLRPLQIRYFRILAIPVHSRCHCVANTCFVRKFAASSDTSDKKDKRRYRDYFKKRGKVTQKTFYDVLGVDPSAKHDDIRLRYLELAKLHHPDSGGSTQEFAEISTAWKVLGNKNEREMYDTRLQYNPETAGDPAEYDGEQLDLTLKVIMSSGFLKVGPYPMALPKTVLIPLVWMGVEQIEGDTPVYRRFYPLGIMWTIFAVLALRQLYITIRDWYSFDEDDRPWMKLSREARSRFAWRTLGLAVGLSILLLRYRKWDFLSNQIKLGDKEERLADAVSRIWPGLIFWTLGWTFAFGPIVGSSTEFMYSHLYRKDLQWNQRIWDSLEFNGSRILQGMGAAATAAVCIQRARAKGVPLKFCGKAATIGLISGRIAGWLLSFALIGNSRRHALKQSAASEPPMSPAKVEPPDQLVLLQREVEQLRQALQQSQTKS